MIAQNIAHAAVMAGSTVLFRSAPALLEELHRQSPEGRRRKLGWYGSVGLLCLDEVGYLSFDDKAADLPRWEGPPVQGTEPQPNWKRLEFVCSIFMTTVSTAEAKATGAPRVYFLRP